MAWAIVIQLGILALSLIASHYLAPKASDERMKAQQLGDMNIPRANEGATMPLAYGTVRLGSPILIRVGDLLTLPVTIGGALIAYSYNIHMRLLLCRGNSALVDTSGGAELVAMFVGDHRVDSLVHDGTTGFADGTGNQVYVVVDDTVLAGDPDGDGEPPFGPGRIGTLFFYVGRWDQTLNSEDIAPTEASPYVPAYRGQVHVGLGWAASLGIDWQIGTSGSIPPYAFVIHNPVIIPGYLAASAPIGMGDANPAAVIYDLLTNEYGCVGSPAASIDLDSFAAVAQTLQDEQHGISLKIENPDDARSIVETILRQIDGTVYEEPTTRKYVLKLIREDYTIGTLFVVDESNVEGAPHLSKSLWEETVNEVVVHYTSRERDWTSVPETAQDAANANSQGGRRRVAEFQFPGVSNAALAGTIAARELNFLSRPLMKLQVTVNRTASNLRPGDAFRFQWATYGAAGLDAVFRVGEIDSGTLEDGKITITAVQDRFAVPGSLFDAEDAADDPALVPTPIDLRTITEAPRWIQQRAYDAGQLVNVDGQRGYYLASPEGADSRYRVDVDDAPDAPARTFPARFALISGYDRTTGPYDTTGVQIDSVVGWTPTAATATQIATDGANLIQIGDEILAFETVTDLGAGEWLLDNVWRGVLDTVPADHLGGALGYVLPGTVAAGAMGRVVLTHGTAYETTTLAAAGNAWTPAAESPVDTLTCRSRVRLPYPVDGLELNGSQTPAVLADDGVTATYDRRNRLALSITRPDAADEAPEAGTTYDLVGYKGDGAQVIATAGITSGSVVHPLGKIGHGLLEVGVDSRLAVALPGSTPTLGAWQVPTLELEAPHHRNLVINGLFNNGTNNWSVTTGSASAGSGSGSLGGGGTMITAASGTATLVFSQEIPIDGYPPAELGAWLEYAAGPTTADADDTIAVTLKSYDAADTLLDTATTAAFHPTAWDRYSLEIAALDPATSYVTVQFTLAAVGELDTIANVGVTEVRLHVGQFTGQLLTNPEFSSALTGWTESAGTWQVLSATLYDCAQYVRPNDGASAQLRQAITPTAGWERGAAAVLRFGRMNDAADDTGAVTLQALNGGGSVIASSATATEAITGSSVWARRYLALELPATTATVRVQLDATRVTGTPLNSCFGSFHLRIHKDLDASVDIDRVLDDPATQRLPATPAEWRAAFPAVAAPNVAILAGFPVGGLGVEPLLEVVGAATMAGTFVCDEGRPDGRITTSCFDLAGGSVQVAPIGNVFGNFRLTEDWCAVVVYRCAEGLWSGSDVTLAARYDGTTTRGWTIGLDADGRPAAAIYGATSNVVMGGTEGTGLTGPGHGALRIVALHHDATTTTATLIDAAGTNAVDSAAAGAHHVVAPAQLTIGAGGGSNAFTGQIARVYLWRGTSTPTVAEIQSTITYATAPSGLTNASTRTDMIATTIGTDTTGVRVELMDPTRVVYTYEPEASGLALLTAPAAVNMMGGALDFSAPFGWSTVGGTIVDGLADPTGMLIGCSISGTSSQGRRRSSVPFDTTGTRYLACLYRAPDANAELVVETSGGSVVTTLTLPQSATWAWFSGSVSWVGSASATGRLWFRTTLSSHTLYLSPLIYAGVTPAPPSAIPLGSTNAMLPRLAVAPSARYCAEGELLVTAYTSTGALATTRNGTNANDRRTIRYDSGGDMQGVHLTGAAASDTAADAPTIDTGALFTARLRWAQAGLMDGAGGYTALRLEQGATVDTFAGRASTWTPGTAELVRVDLGHDDGSDAARAAITRVRLRCREPRL